MKRVGAVGCFEHKSQTKRGDPSRKGRLFAYGWRTCSLRTVKHFINPLGGWLDPGESIGIAGRGFLLEQRTTSYPAQSDAGSNPPVAFPVFDPGAAGTPLSFSNQPPGSTLPGEAGLFITQAGNFAGGLTVSSSSRLWGAETNGLLDVVRNEHWQMDGVALIRRNGVSRSAFLNGV